MHKYPPFSRRDTFWQVVFFALLLPSVSYAQTPPPNAVAEVLCLVGSWLWGPLGQLIGVLGIIALGIASMFGKLQISSVLTTMAGIALIFGAQTVTNALGLTASCPANPNTPTAIDIMQSPIYHMFGCLIQWFTGPLGKSLATVAIIVLGIFALYGKISYHQALVVGAGIAAMFGAVSLVSNLGVMVAGTKIEVNSTASLKSFPLYLACGKTSMLEFVYCSLISWFNGPLGKGMATVGIIIVGIGALYGKVSWGIAMIAGIGMAMIFGGTTIVDALGGNGGATCPTGSGAQGDLALATLFCNVVGWFNGAIGKGIATIAVIIFGMGALFGKVSWQVAIVVAMGVALVFGGTTIVDAVGGNGKGPCPRGSIVSTG